MKNDEDHSPGSGETFKLTINKSDFNRDPIKESYKAKVTKVYQITWFKKLLIKFGFSVKIMELEKLKDNEKL